METQKGFGWAMSLVSQSNVRNTEHWQENTSRKIDLLLDAGYIQVEGMEMGSKVSHQRIYRVTHPNSLEARRAAIELMPEKPSITAKKKANYFNEKHPKAIHETETSEYNNDSITI